jgi:hypothetical protein
MAACRRHQNAQADQGASNLFLERPMQAEALAFDRGTRRRSGADGRTIVEGLVRLGDIALVALSGIAASHLRFVSGVAAPRALGVDDGLA